MAKKLKNHALDRLSDLPDSLLHVVLSFVPTRSVVQTCLLSKRWKDIWRSIPYFDLQQSSFSTPNSFKKYVDSLLHIHHGCDINKLKLSCMYFADDPFRINSWLIAAHHRNLQVLDLDIQAKDSFDLTNLIFNCSSMRVMKLGLNFTNLNLPTSVFLPLLKTLILKSVSFQNPQTTQTLFSSCPSLENLDIVSCHFSAMHLDSLTLYSCQPLNLNLVGSFPQTVSLSTPNLQTLKLYHTPATSSFHILPDIVPNLKRLELPISFSDSSTMLIKKILCETFPNIETLVLNSIAGKKLHSSESRTSNEEEKMPSKYKLSHLKSVRINGFRGCENEIKFTKFLLTNAVVLEKLVIVGPENLSSEEKTEMMKIGEELLAHPRSFSAVGILFI